MFLILSARCLCLMEATSLGSHIEMVPVSYVSDSLRQVSLPKWATSLGRHIDKIQVSYDSDFLR